MSRSHGFPNGIYNGIYNRSTIIGDQNRAPYTSRATLALPREDRKLLTDKLCVDAPDRYNMREGPKGENQHHVTAVGQSIMWPIPRLMVHQDATETRSTGIGLWMVECMSQSAGKVAESGEKNGYIGASWTGMSSLSTHGHWFRGKL